MLPCIFGLSGPELTADERDFFRAADPAGFILFARNCSSRPQLRALTDSLRALCGRDELLILIDQEGGRVSRLKPPEWPEFPAAWRFAELYAKAPISAIEAARANGEAMATLLAEAGVNVDCAPTLDLRHDGAHDVVGDRSLGSEPMQVAALGRAWLQGLESGGVLGVLKHMPGHGRATVDSHVALPITDQGEALLEQDLAPFRALRDAPIAMVAHMLYQAWDDVRPASLSPSIITDIIRGRIGFDGLLVSDDLAMGALTGSPGERAGQAIAAGCDLALYCSGVLEDNQQIANSLGDLSETASARLERALARVRGKAPTSAHEALAAKRDALLSFA